MKKANKPQQIYGTSKAPMTGQTMVVGKKPQKQIDYMAMYEQKAKDYIEILELYRNCIKSGVSNETYEEALLKCEELIAANKLCGEQLATERKNVELLQQQVHNKDVYIGRLNSVIGQLNIQIFKA